MKFVFIDCNCQSKELLQDFSEAANALGSLNLSEGWSNLSLRSRHSESGAQDLELRNQRGDYSEASSSGRGEPYNIEGQHNHLVGALTRQGGVSILLGWMSLLNLV